MKSEVYIHPSACIDEGAQIGKGTKIWHYSHVMAHAQIGTNCILGQNVFIGGKARIGNGVKIQNNVSIYDSVILEDDVFCGPSCVFTNVKTPRAFIERKSEFATTIVKCGATIGANATIICGITIGAYSMIGAGAVVTKSVKAYALMAGNPAKQKGWVSRSGLTLDDSLRCPETGEQYQLSNGELLLTE